MRVCTCDFYSLRIFVVEDHKDTLDALRKYLEQMGHIVLSASSKAEALKQIPMADCHVLISDIGLPDGNGWELMQELENLSPRYAIAISGYGMKADREMSAKAGFRHHLAKPLLPHKLHILLEEASVDLKKKG